MPRIFVGLLALALLGCNRRDSDPFVDWKPISNDTFVLQPGQIFTGYATPQSPVFGYKPKVAIEAKSPVTIGWIREIYRDPASAVNAPTFCLQQHVLQTTAECFLPTDKATYVFLVRDERTASGQFAAGVLGGLGSRQAMDQALVRNDVHVNLSAYTCVRNCQQQH